MVSVWGIAERKQAEEKLRFQGRLLEAVGEAVIALDMDGRVVYWNRAAERLYGWSSEEALGRNLKEMVVPEDCRERAAEITRQVKETGNWSGEFMVRRKDGTCFPVLANNTPMHDEAGVMVGIISVLREVTERKRAEQALRESEQRFKSAFRDAAIGMALVGVDGRRLQVNRSLCRMLGYPEEELLEKTFQEITHPADLEKDVGHLRRMLAGEIETYQTEKRYLHKEGHVVWILLSVSLVHDEEGDPLYFISQIQDVTERKLAEERLRQAEARYRTLVERMPAVVYVQEIGGPESAMYMSPQIEALTGYSPEECKDPDLRWRIVHPDDREWIQSEDERAVEPGEFVTTEYRVVHRDGRTVWVRNESVVVEEEEGGSRYWQGFMVDITERKRVEERLHHQAHHDLLTDLPNRQLFLDRLGQALKRTRRRPGRKVAVLFVDLDNFKVVNDSLGHEVGDLLLVRVGERLRRCLRPEDTLSRFGGDEFAILVENVQSPGDAVRVAERIIEELRSPFVLEGRELVLRASVGIALGSGRTRGPGELLKDADTAMYRAKEEVSGYRIFHSSMNEQALRRLKLENDMRRALEAQEFVVHHQPIVDLKTGGAWGSEALVRWDHPERGLLDPSRFVPVAEETGLIVPLGQWVLEEACRQAAEWQRECSEATPLVLCVNLSARQLRRQDLAETVKGVLRSTGLGGRRLCLDITETLYITVLEGNTAALNDLRRTGVRISIDDFGMGYSSLSYLKRLPADTLKVDRSFVAGLGEDAEDTAIVRMIIELAHTLGMRIIAEGVESEEQAEQLREMGCDLGQGYYFAEPSSPAALSDFFKEEPGIPGVQAP